MNTQKAGSRGAMKAVIVVVVVICDLGHDMEAILPFP